MIRIIAASKSRPDYWLAQPLSVSLHPLVYRVGTEHASNCSRGRPFPSAPGCNFPPSRTKR